MKFILLIFGIVVFAVFVATWDSIRKKLAVKYPHLFDDINYDGSLTKTIIILIKQLYFYLKKKVGLK